MRYTLGILCPIRGAKKWEECMNCELKYEFKCYPPPLLMYLYKLREEELKEKFDYSVTEMLDCPRKIFYAKTKGEFVNPQRIYNAWKGILSHEVMEKWTPVMNGTLIETRFFVKYDKYIITLKPDRIDKDVLYDFKFVHEIPVFRKPYRYHAQQLNLYKFFLNNFTSIKIQKAKLVYMTYRAMEVVEVDLLSDEILEEQVKKKLKFLEQSIPVAFDVNENWRCRDCYFFTICFMDLIKEGYNLDNLPGGIK
jgi:CRISPR/Cas system-associated exonuclease Cas4 (RecB family)